MVVEFRSASYYDARKHLVHVSPVKQTSIFLLAPAAFAAPSIPEQPSLPSVRGGDVNIEGNVAAGDGSTARGGDATIEGGDGYSGASGGIIYLGPGYYKAGDGGLGGSGGNLIIKAGDAKP